MPSFPFLGALWLVFGVQQEVPALRATGFQNTATCSELGFLRGWFVFVEQAAQDGSAGDPSGW
jgi:hypothetical protein